MLAYGRRFAQRTWAIEGCQGIGRHIANRLLADDEQVVNVPPKLSARARIFATGQGRKTDETDAHSIALAVAVRVAELRMRHVIDAPGPGARTAACPVVRFARRGCRGGRLRPEELFPSRSR